MSRRSISRSPLFFTIALGLHFACGKRSDPLAPYVKTPALPGVIEVSQTGDEVEIRVTAPKTTTENRPLPVIELEWRQAPLLGEFAKVSTVLFREEVAPGEARVRRFPRPSSDARFSVLAIDGKSKSAPTVPCLFKPAPVPPAPTEVSATNTATGVALAWTNPPGAEPWPTPTPPATPSPTPFLLIPLPPPCSPLPVVAPAPTPVPTPSAPALGSSVQPSPPGVPGATSLSPATPPPTPAVPPQSTPAPVAPPPLSLPGDVSSPAASAPPPLPTPTPGPLAGIRIFRTDGTPRLAREPLQASSWLDNLSKPGEEPCYSLTYATSLKPLVESAPTTPVCVEIKDIVPPEPPGRLVGDIGADFLELSWIGSLSLDTAFYQVYRTTGTQARKMIIQTEGLVLRVRDSDMAPGPRTYEVIAVDRGGNESAPGPALKIILP